ncbi:MAG: antitoxin [Lentisphaerae bacterium]|nr:antitoxin [Lentisphaerota bacterium]MBT4817870.1 antitoxin [Lentisphaerota bacterium]MBT5605747.1 antitoxin [Lentisphaerota bacterium]MBT7053930.1 antitoxin [Lentisphaerota bacterium]MBT7843928.1 antitoxin [Lentisphaerota bacterium]
MATLQVRSMDDQLYRALGARAAMDNRSISQEVIAIIKDYLSRPASQHQTTTEQFLQLCGSWQDDRAEDEIAADIRDARTSSPGRFREPF